MAHLILVTGGARSGKSSFAESLTDPFAGKRTYIATAPLLDEEMVQRVARHKELRAGKGWQTLEEEVDLCGALKKAQENGAQAILVDCLTLWINNLLYHDATLCESRMAQITKEFLAAADSFPGTLITVLNEVGMGLVPETALSRTFRDCSGRCGQLMAAHAQEVYLCVCSIPMQIKGGKLSK